TRSKRDWSSDVCSSDLLKKICTPLNHIRQMNTHHLYLFQNFFLRFSCHRCTNCWITLPSKLLHHTHSPSILIDISIAFFRKNSMRKGGNCGEIKGRARIVGG